MLKEVINIIADVLQLGERAAQLDIDTPLLGNIPELDSMAVVTIITTIEENFGITVDDDEISADTFESVGSLVSFIESKV